MRILFDQGFPVLIEQYRQSELELWRWSGERLNDVALLEVARAENFQAVVFLGSAAFAGDVGDRVIDAARNLGLYVAPTAEPDPVEAVRAVSNNLQALRRAARRGGADWIYMRELRPVKAETPETS